MNEIKETFFFLITRLGRRYEEEQKIFFQSFVYLMIIKCITMESQSRNTCTFPSSENEPLRGSQGNSKEYCERRERKRMFMMPNEIEFTINKVSELTALCSGIFAVFKAASDIEC